MSRDDSQSRCKHVGSIDAADIAFQSWVSKELDVGVGTYRDTVVDEASAEPYEPFGGNLGSDTYVDKTTADPTPTWTHRGSVLRK